MKSPHIEHKVPWFTTFREINYLRIYSFIIHYFIHSRKLTSAKLIHSKIKYDHSCGEHFYNDTAVIITDILLLCRALTWLEFPNRK